MEKLMCTQNGTGYKKNVNVWKDDLERQREVMWRRERGRERERHRGRTRVLP